MALDRTIWNGDPNRGALAQRLEENTPAGPIEAPLLIGQGANDPRVTQVESDQIVRAMQA